MSVSQRGARLLVPVLILGTVPLLATTASAAPGDLDPTFGTGGIVTTQVGADDEARDMVIQPDGKIVVVGSSTQDVEGCCDDFALVRYTPTGALDPTFGGDGTVTTSLGPYSDFAQAVALQSNGKIIAAGSSFSARRLNQFALVRYTSTGALDPTFGSDGTVTTGFGFSDDFAYAVAVQADGKIVVGGYTSMGGDSDFALARYTTTGDLDPTFGSGGKVITAIGSGIDYLYAVAIQSDGKIVAVGTTLGTNYDFALARYTPAGVLDTSFGSGGKVVTPVGSYVDQAFAVAIQDNGKIVAGGTSIIGGTYDFALARYTPSGALDPIFGSGGTVHTDFLSGGDVAYGLAIQADGKIVAAGQGASSTGDTFAVARYRRLGGLDSTFGTGGRVMTVSPTGGASGARAVGIQSDGKIVVAGSSGAGFMVARYLA